MVAVPGSGTWRCMPSSRKTTAFCWGSERRTCPKGANGGSRAGSWIATRPWRKVLRELREETGWEGRVVSLLRINSRPDRPREDRQNIAFDFLIEPLEKRGE